MAAIVNTAGDSGNVVHAITAGSATVTTLFTTPSNANKLFIVYIDTVTQTAQGTPGVWTEVLSKKFIIGPDTIVTEFTGNAASNPSTNVTITRWSYTELEITN